MTVSSTTKRNSYTGNGSTTTFAYSFKIFDDDDITVILRTTATGAETVQTKTTHYSVTGVGSASGGNVVFGSAPTSAQTVVLLRQTAQTQATDYTPNDPFPAASHEDALDKLTLVAQDQQDELDRSIKLSRTNTMTSTEFTVTATNRANKIFAFDSSGELSVTQEIGTFRGDWAASTSYAVRDLVKDTSTNNIFIVNEAHTSSGSQPLTTNANSAKYDLIVDAAAAATSATAAASSASTASGHASTATTKASEAASSASTASSHKDDAETAKAAAETAQAAAETAKAAAETALDNFDDIFLGSKSSDPSTDNDGDALTTGDIYFNTSSNTLRVFNGSSFQDASISTTATTAELNIMDGDTSASSTTVADADRVVFNDAGTMKQVAVTDLAAYFDDEITAMPNLVTTGALNSGSITSGFGAIDNGSSNITTTGVGTFGSLDISGDIDVDGTTNLDVVDIDGAVDMASTLQVGGITTIQSASPELHFIDTTNNTDAIIRSNNNGDIVFEADENAERDNTIIRFDVDGSEKMRLDTSGNVGIGLDTPTMNSTGIAAHVHSGTSSTAAALRLTNADSGSGASDGFLVTLWNDDNAYVYNYENTNLIFATNSTERMRIDSSGNVGIGTSSPAHNLEIVATAAGSVNDSLQIRNNATSSGTGSRIRFINSTDSSSDANGASISSVRNGDDNHLVFETENSERMRVNASGHLNIGQTSTNIPGQNNTTAGISLRSVGDGYFSRDNDLAVNANRNGGDGTCISIRRGGTQVGAISVTTSSTTYNTSSDARLKSNIQDAASASDKIDAIQVRQFDWNETGNHQDYGLIAQELQPIEPLAVVGSPDSEEMMGVDNSKLIPMLIKEIQELRSRVAALEE